MSRYAKRARSAWAECGICGFDFPQSEMTRHYKFNFLVDLKCADSLTHLDYWETFRLPETERTRTTQQRVPDQGKVVPDGFTFGTSDFDVDEFIYTPGPHDRQGPQ